MKKLVFLTALAISLLFWSCAIDHSSTLNGIRTTSQTEENYYGTEVVQLLWASTYTHSKYGMSSTDRNFKIRVKNIAYDKKVAVYHKLADGSWTEFFAAYAEPADYDYEIWTLSINSNYGNEFAVKFQANGETWWDNNFGLNYCLKTNEGAIMGTGIHVLSWNSNISESSGSFYGTIDIRNLDYYKEVEVLYSTDNWSTHQTVSAEYEGPEFYYGYSSSPSPNQYGIEKWSYRANIGSADKVQFAVQYTVNGQTYWDNHFGRNYTVNKTVY